MKYLVMSLDFALHKNVNKPWVQHWGIYSTEAQALRHRERIIAKGREYVMVQPCKPKVLPGDEVTYWGDGLKYKYVGLIFNGRISLHYFKGPGNKKVTYIADAFAKEFLN